MNPKRPDLAAPEVVECTRSRLAENQIVTVDVCSCGVIQMHLGAITLRMAPCAVSELIATLDYAMQKHAALTGRDPKLLDHPAGRTRGQA